ncbi:aminotransferase class V-fold PLP-dependent enzyme [Modestobacter sp. I12A-02628]|uniref:DegT/DnrJ/EryC1/StrS family aminotransferase n=1 Tax=Goekera deserti TaxID=2497753 RepID=A0A7K3WCY2_9ACTN|nr:DegT/DnrJ/EryC1/StrS family aminotransferase [Goekera deserti]MPQ96918.1 aminotransferase class V-fold PLP-dependent enzyme [Goekera deserti]NDI46769.1 aminotransferase class V-fold PLP-dependent enzyme [Goekera deserti]NEL54338.1 DegT/DnrJ/EryC1/StrS family aminotransferase [Goekera deserti]
MINIFQPTLGAAELAAVGEVFNSNWLGRGRRTADFEKAFAGHIGVDPAQVVSTNSCTEALFLIMEMLELGPGDEVVLPSISFVGAANAIAARGARPVFCDVDPHTLNPTPDHVRAVLTPATAAVLVLHYGGRPGAIADIATLCREVGLPLIEDTACAVASAADGHAAGTFGDFAAWSFDAMKILVTGDGGMLYARDSDRVRDAASRLYLGMREASGLAQAMATDSAAPQRWWEFELDGFGRRSITNDIASAIGLVQLARLPEFLQRRSEIATCYDEQLAGLPVRLPPPLPEGHTTSHFFYWIGLPAGVRDVVANRLLRRGVYTTFRYHPLHTVAAYEHQAGPLAGAEQAAEETLCLPMHQGLDSEAVGRVVSEVREAVLAEVSS